MIKEVCWGWRGRLIKFCPREITDRQGVNLCFPRKAFVLHQLVCCCQHYDVIASSISDVWSKTFLQREGEEVWPDVLFFSTLCILAGYERLVCCPFHSVCIECPPFCPAGGRWPNSFLAELEAERRNNNSPRN